MTWLRDHIALRPRDRRQHDDRRCEERRVKEEELLVDEAERRQVAQELQELDDELAVYTRRDPKREW